MVKAKELLSSVEHPSNEAIEVVVENKNEDKAFFGLKTEYNVEPFTGYEVDEALKNLADSINTFAEDRGYTHKCGTIKFANEQDALCEVVGSLEQYDENADDGLKLVYKASGGSGGSLGEGRIMFPGEVPDPYNYGQMARGIDLPGQSIGFRAEDISKIPKDDQEELYYEVRATMEELGDLSYIKPEYID